jgi:hypothetical protein
MSSRMSVSIFDQEDLVYQLQLGRNQQLLEIETPLCLFKNETIKITVFEEEGLKV